MVSIKDVVRSSVKVPEFDKHLKKAGGHIDRNVLEITLKMKTIVRKTLMIKSEYSSILYIFFQISIMHPRCIKEVFSDATVFIADFGLFLHHIGSDSNPGMTLEEPSRLRNRDVLRSCLYQSKEKLNIYEF